MPASPRDAAKGPPAWVCPTHRSAADTPDHNDLVLCGCGRRQQADMMVDCQTIPVTQRDAWFGHSARFVCDACRHRAELLEVMTPQALALALGAPADVVRECTRRHAAVLALRGQRVQDSPEALDAPTPEPAPLSDSTQDP